MIANDKAIKAVADFIADSVGIDTPDPLMVNQALDLIKSLAEKGHHIVSEVKPHDTNLWTARWSGHSFHIEADDQGMTIDGYGYSHDAFLDLASYIVSAAAWAKGHQDRAGLE